MILGLSTSNIFTNTELLLLVLVKLCRVWREVDLLHSLIPRLKPRAIDLIALRERKYRKSLDRLSSRVSNRGR